jgi:hypothetical protein
LPTVKPKQLDLSKGSVLHIEDFKTFGFEPKNKYVYIIGHEDAAHVFAFVVSSQKKWAEHPFLSRELVCIPKGTCAGLRDECWIQCFYQVHRLDVAELQGRSERHEIKHKGTLPQAFLEKVRNVIECSDVLKSYEIADCLGAIDNDRSKI